MRHRNKYIRLLLAAILGLGGLSAQRPAFDLDVGLIDDTMLLNRDGGGVAGRRAIGTHGGPLRGLQGIGVRSGPCQVAEPRKAPAEEKQYDGR